MSKSKDLLQQKLNSLDVELMLREQDVETLRTNLHETRVELLEAMHSCFKKTAEIERLKRAMVDDKRQRALELAISSTRQTNAMQSKHAKSVVETASTYDKYLLKGILPE